MHSPQEAEQHRRRRWFWCARRVAPGAVASAFISPLEPGGPRSGQPAGALGTCYVCAVVTHRPTLEELHVEDVELQQRMAHYARRTTELTLELERIDKAMEHDFRRRLQVAHMIETEKCRLALDGQMAFPLSRTG